MSASSFADKIGVPRSSISHILSGRNKPSLDFVIKLVTAFPETNLYWLLNGIGSFPSPTENEVSNSGKVSDVLKKSDSDPSRISNPKPNTAANSKTVEKIKSKQIDKVLIFYTDGTFESYTENPML